MESRLTRYGLFLLCTLIWLTLVLKAVGVYGQSTDLANQFGGLDLPVDKPGPKSPAPKPGAPTPATQPPKAPEPDPEPQLDEKPPTIYGSEIRTDHQTIIYVIDISGSMGLDLAITPDEHGILRFGYRIDRARTELAKSISSLPEAWRFEVIAFDCDTYVWAGELRQATLENKQSAIGWAYMRKPQGATGTAHAVGHALLEYTENKLVILLTDGAANCNTLALNGNVPPEKHREEIRETNHVKRPKPPGPAVIHVFGIACPTASDMETFCRGVAQDNQGFFQKVE